MKLPGGRAARRVRLQTAVVLLGLVAGAAGTALLACSRRAPAVAGVPDVVDFGFHVRPILSDRCFACHGPDERTRKAGLRLDTQEGRCSRSCRRGTRVVPGQPEASELVRPHHERRPGRQMPPPDRGTTLTEREIERLERWIEEGAAVGAALGVHPPVAASLPAVQKRGRAARNEVDRFVLAGMRRRLAPRRRRPGDAHPPRWPSISPGLPPTPEEIDAFLADHSPDAYEKLVDRLLASPAYGERMAADWLDVARYADTHGFQIDGERDMWPWRDWVIDAFNGNMPFDQFIAEQLAGDLLPDATREQRVATGFNRNHMQRRGRHRPRSSATSTSSTASTRSAACSSA